MCNLLQKIFVFSSTCVLFQFIVCADVQVFDQNVQSPVSNNNVDIPDSPPSIPVSGIAFTGLSWPKGETVDTNAKIVAAMESAGFATSAIEEAKEQLEIVDSSDSAPLGSDAADEEADNLTADAEEADNLTADAEEADNLTADAEELIVSGDQSAQIALTVLANANVDLTNGSGIDQIVDDIIVKYDTFSPEDGTTVLVAVTSAVATNFLEVVDSSSDTFSRDSFVAAVKQATNTIVSSAKLTSLLSVSSAVEVKKNMLSLAKKVLAENGVSGKKLDAVVKQVESIISAIGNGNQVTIPSNLINI